MIPRLAVFLVAVLVAVAVANRIRSALSVRRRGSLAGKGAGSRPPVEPAGKCPACGAWVVAGTRCRCGG